MKLFPRSFFIIIFFYFPCLCFKIQTQNTEEDIIDFKGKKIATCKCTRSVCVCVCVCMCALRKEYAQQLTHATMHAHTHSHLHTHTRTHTHAHTNLHASFANNATLKKQIVF